jgi:hypothetical protein
VNGYKIGGLSTGRPFDKRLHVALESQRVEVLADTQCCFPYDSGSCFPVAEW